MPFKRSSSIIQGGDLEEKTYQTLRFKAALFIELPSGTLFSLIAKVKESLTARSQRVTLL